MRPSAARRGDSLSAESTLWNQCLRVLQVELPEQQFNTWIRPLQAVDDDAALHLLAPNRFVVDWLRQHYMDRILELVGDRGTDVEVLLEVGSRVVASPPPSQPRSAPP